MQGVLSSFDVRVVADEARQAVAATLKSHWQQPYHETVDAAEFRNDDGGRLVILQVPC